MPKAWFNGPCGRVLVSKQREIAEAEVHVLDGSHAPGRAEAVEIGGLANARFGDIAVNVVHFAPARPSPPQHVEHLVVPCFGIIPGKEFVGEAELVVPLILEEIGELAVHTKRADVAEARGLGGRGEHGVKATLVEFRVLLPAELIGAFGRILPVVLHQPRDAAAESIDIGIISEAGLRRDLLRRVSCL